MDSEQLRGEVALLGLTTVWGTTFVLVGDVLLTWPPLLLLTARFCLATCVFAPWVIAAGLKAGSRRWVTAGIVLGFLLFGGFALQTFSLLYTSPSRCAFFTALATLLVPLLSRYWRTPSGRRGTTAALLLGCAGVVLLLGAGLTGPARKGDLLALGCAAVFAVQITTAQRFARAVPLLPLVGVELLTAAVCSALSTLSFEATAPLPGSPKFPVVAYLALVATAFPYVAQLYGQRHTTADRAAFIYALEPVFAVFFAAIAFEQGLRVTELAGGTLIVAATLIAGRDLQGIALRQRARSPQC